MLWQVLERDYINIDVAFVFALFYLKGVAPKEVKLMTIYRGVVTFALLQLPGLALVSLRQELAASVGGVVASGC